MPQITKLRLVAAIIALVGILSFSYGLISNYNERVRNEQNQLLNRANADGSFGFNEDWGDHRPPKRLAVTILSIFALVAISKRSKLVFATLFTASSLIVMALWVYRDAYAIFADWPTFSGRHWYELLLLAGNPFDYILLILLTFFFHSLAGRLCVMPRYRPVDRRNLS